MKHSADIDRIYNRQKELSSARSPWLTLWQRTAELVSPQLDHLLRQLSPGSERGQARIFDSMPMQSVQRFAAGLEAALIPRGSRWHQLSTGDPDLDDNLEVRAYLERVSDILWSRRYRPRSAFPSQAQEYLHGLGTFGTSIMLLEDANGSVRYRNLYLGDCYLGYNSDGQCDTLHRDLRLTARQAVQHFGDDTPKEIRDAYESATQSEKQFTFLHAICPRQDFDPSRLDQKGMPYLSAYFWNEGKGDARLIREEGYHEFPASVSRYIVANGEDYGRSAAMFALADIRTLQALRYIMLEQANLAIDPVLLTPDDSMLSEYPLEAGTRVSGGVNQDGRPMIMPLQNGARLDVGAEMVAEIRNSVDNAMLGQFFRALVENPQMTATQALLLAQQSGSLIAPQIQRQHTEFLDPMLRREAGVAHRAGALPDVPAILAQHLKATRRPLDLTFESPATKAIKSADALATLRTFESLAPFASIKPEILDQFDPNELAKLVAEGNGMPARVMRDPGQAADAQAQQMEIAVGADLLTSMAPAAAKALASGQAAKV